MNKVLAVCLAAATCLSIVAMPLEAVADRRASLEEGPIVRRKLLFRSNRFELSPSLGSTMNDAYKRNYLVGIDANYHLTNHFGLGASGAFGVLTANTDLLNQVNETVDEHISNGLAYSTTTVLFDLHLSYVPLFGKISVFDTNVVNYDFHLEAGFGGALVAADGTVDDDQLSGFKPAPVFGMGVRLFIADSFAINFNVKDFVYSSADALEKGAEPQTELRNNFALSVGASFFFPTDVKVSR